MIGKIRIFPSIFEGKHIEEIEAEGTVGGWLSERYAAYNANDPQPFILKINGVEIPHTEWMTAEITDDTCLYFSPQGPALPYIVAAIIAAIVVYYAMSSMSLPKSRSQQEGSKIAPSGATANTVRLGEVIPEIAGTYRRFPDYLLPVHRYYVNKREQYAELMLCIGKGEFDIPTSKIKIGDTPVNVLGSDVDYTIYQPGDDLTFETASAWWHSNTEVGSPTTGGAGLEIKSIYTAPRIPDATSYIFYDYTVEIPSGAGEFPSEWIVGTIVKIENFKTYTVYNDSFLAVIQLPAGQDFTELQPYVGMAIEITGNNEGQYKIGSYTPYVASPLQLAEITLTYDNGNPVSALTTGEMLMSIGYRNQQFEITGISSAAITVDRLTDTGVVESGWNGFDYYESTDAIIQLSGADIEGDWCGPFTVCPKGKETDSVEVDIFFQDGLVYFDKKGRAKTYTVTVEVSWRESGSSDTWNTETFTYSDNTLDQIGFTETISITPRCNPEFRMRRIGADSADTKIRDTVQWTGLRALLTAPASYAGVTTIALKIRGDSRIAGQAENKINVECTRKIPVRSGGSWTGNTATRSIAAFAAHIAHDIGYTDAQIDMDELDRLDAIWTDREDYYDFVCDEGPVRDQINQCLRPGYAELTVDRGRMRFVRDETRTTYDQMYTPQNQTEGLSRKFAAVRPDDRDGVDVEYMDSDTWTMQTVQCRLDGDNGYRVQKIKLDGVTDRTRAWRIGMRVRRDAKYRRWQYEWKTELDGLCSRYLSFCAVSDDVPGYGKSCLIRSAVEDSAGTMLTLSEPITISGDSIVAFRNQDGTLSGPYTATAGANDFEVYAVDAHAPEFIDGNELPHAVIGTVEKWAFPVLIKKIKPDNYESVSLQAINYSADVYADDDNAPGQNLDPNYGDVILLLDFDEANGTTTFECLKTGRAFTTVGSAATSNTYTDGGYNFGHFAGTGNYIYAEPDSTFLVPYTHLSVDAKIKIAASGGDNRLIFDTCRLNVGSGSRSSGFALYVDNGVPKVFVSGDGLTFGSAMSAGGGIWNFGDTIDLLFTYQYVSGFTGTFNISINGIAGTPITISRILDGADGNQQDGISIGVVANSSGTACGEFLVRKLRITRGVVRGSDDYALSHDARPYHLQVH